MQALRLYYILIQYTPLGLHCISSTAIKQTILYCDSVTYTIQSNPLMEEPLLHSLEVPSSNVLGDHKL